MPLLEKEGTDDTLKALYPGADSLEHNNQTFLNTTNNTSSITNNKKVNVTYSDHSAIMADIATSKQRIRKQKITCRDLRKLRANPGKFPEELSKIDWAKIRDLDVDSMVDFWT